MANGYKNQARQELTPGYNKQIQALKNQLASNQANLEGQKTGINANYDTQVEQQNIANVKAKNNISNSNLGRGLSRSSIVASNLGEADQINNRKVGYIENARTGSLNDIEMQKRILAENSNNSIATMEGDLEDRIMALARQLEDSAWDKNYKNRTLSMQERAQQQEAAYRNSMLAMQRENQAWERQQAMAKLAKADEMSYADRLNYMAQINEIGGAGLSDDDALAMYDAYGVGLKDNLLKEYLKKSKSRYGDKTVDAVSGANVRSGRVDTTPVQTGSSGKFKNWFDSLVRPSYNNKLWTDTVPRKEYNNKLWFQR